MKTGQVVFSKMGHDSRKVFLIVATESQTDGEYAFLADGKQRTLAKPKKKKFKHIQPTNTVLTLPQSLTDSDVRKLLKPFAVYEITKKDRFQESAEIQALQEEQAFDDWLALEERSKRNYQKNPK